MSISPWRSLNSFNSTKQGWHQLESRVSRVGDAAQETSEDLEEATRHLLDELKEGYERIRNAI